MVGLDAWATGSGSPMLNKTHNPVIEGDTLYVGGVIDSHIYDFLARSQDDLVGVSHVSLNSFGGNSRWALEIGRKIRALGLSTRVDKGSHCASACIYLLGSGVHRSAHESIWLGLHGARLGGAIFMAIASSCAIDQLAKFDLITLEDPTCQVVLDKWYRVAKATTDESFDLMEDAGVLSSLRATYFAMDEDEAWFKEGNILRIKDWIMTPEEALQFRLIHQIVAD